MNKRAQVTLEASLLIAICVAAFLAMQGYLKAAIQGNWRKNADSFSEEQFDPGKSKVFALGSDPQAGVDPYTWQSQEQTAIKIIDPRMKVTYLDNLNQEIYQGNFSQPSLPGSDVIRINGWGTYESGGTDEDEE